MIHFIILDLFVYSRVHISHATLRSLRNVYEVEPGFGQTRDAFLKVSLPFFSLAYFFDGSTSVPKPRLTSVKMFRNIYESGIVSITSACPPFH